MLFLVLLMVSLWGGSALPVDTTQPEVYSPVQLSQYCNAADNYCYYVDQIHPGTVRASPYTATDERKSPNSHPFPSRDETIDDDDV